MALARRGGLALPLNGALPAAVGAFKWPSREPRAVCAAPWPVREPRPARRCLATAPAAGAWPAAADGDLCADLLVAHGLRLLTARPQAAAELRRKLGRVCASRRRSKLAHLRQPFEGADCAAAVEGALARLRALGFVDDAAYALYHVAQRAQHRPRSQLHLRGELAAKGVAASVSAAAVAGADDAAAALQLARRRPARDDARAITAHLARKGFAFSAASSAARQAVAERESVADEAGGDAAGRGGGGAPLR